MAKSKTSSSKGQSVPKDLHDHMFYGLSLDDEQEVFRDAIWDTQKKIIFANAKAGTLKAVSTIASTAPTPYRNQGAFPPLIKGSITAAIALA